MELVLASSSPRRQDLLRQLGFSFQTLVSDIDESLPQSITAKQAVQQLALKKAKAVAAQVENHLVIGADTVVVLEDEILGKPRDSQHAIQMLKKIQGRSHQVHSGIAIVEVKQGVIRRFETAQKKTDVWLLPLTNEQIEWYVGTGEPLDKAGAYAIQGLGACMVEKINGCYFNVVGMSLSLLTQMIQKMNYRLLDFLDNK